MIITVLKKQNIILVVLFALLILINAFIWHNSMKNSEASNADSDVIEEIVEPILEKVGITDPDDINFTVRKAAHFSEFMMLGLAASGIVCCIKKMYEKTLVGCGLFYGLAVAVTDEFLQSFSDRTSSVSDVLIDFSGFTLGFLLILLTVFLPYACKKR